MNNLTKCREILLRTKFGIRDASDEVHQHLENIEKLNGACLSALDPRLSGDLQLSVFGELFRNYALNRNLTQKWPLVLCHWIISLTFFLKLLKSCGLTTLANFSGLRGGCSEKVFVFCGFPSHSFNKSGYNKSCERFDSMITYVSRNFGDGLLISIAEYQVSGVSYAIHQGLVDPPSQVNRLVISRRRSLFRFVLDAFWSILLFCRHFAKTYNVDASLVFARYEIVGGGFRRLERQLSANVGAAHYFIMQGFDTGDFGYCSEPNIFEYRYTCPRPSLIRELCAVGSNRADTVVEKKVMLKYLDMPLTELATKFQIVGYTKSFDEVRRVKTELLESKSVRSHTNIHKSDDCGQLGFGGTLDRGRFRGIDRKKTVIIFPHQPLTKDTLAKHTFFGDYISSAEFFEAFFHDILCAIDSLSDEINLIVKPKYDERKQGDFFSNLERNNPRISCVSAYTRLSDLASLADYCISVPYTGASEAFAALGGVSSFYFPSEFALDSVRRLGSCPVLVGRSELENFFERLSSNERSKN